MAQEQKDYQLIQLNIDEILPNQYNPKKSLEESSTNAKEYKRLLKSLGNGYEDKIKVRVNEDGKYEIVDGYHRRLALKELGYTKVAVINLGTLSLAQGIANTLSSEEIKIPLDDIQVAKLLKGMKEEGTLHSVEDYLPYTPDEVELKIEALAFEMEKPPKEKEEEEEPEEIDGPCKVFVIAKDDSEAKIIQADILGIGYQSFIK